MIFKALQDHIARHAMTYLMAMLLGMAASLTAVYDNFWILEPADAAKLGWWQWLALFSKCIAPFATTVVAYLIKSPVAEPAKPADANTTPPIPLK